MNRYVVITFEVDEKFTPDVHLTDDQVQDQIEDFITNLLTVPAAWVYEAGEVVEK